MGSKPSPKQIILAMLISLLGLILLTYLGPEAESNPNEGDCYKDGPRSSLTCEYKE